MKRTTDMTAPATGLTGPVAGAFPEEREDRMTQEKKPRMTTPLTAWGETKTLKQWTADPRCVVAHGTLRARMRLGWEAQKALSMPTRNYVAHYLGGPDGQERTLRSWAMRADCVVPYSTLHDRVVYRGWPLDLARMTPAREIPAGLDVLTGG
jgi:hypothetical protein